MSRHIDRKKRATEQVLQSGNNILTSVHHYSHIILVPCNEWPASFPCKLFTTTISIYTPTNTQGKGRIILYS